MEKYSLAFIVLGIILSILGYILSNVTIYSYIIIGFGVLIIILGVFKRSKKRLKVEEREEVEDDEESEEEEGNDEDNEDEEESEKDEEYCSKCGAKIKAGSIHCKKCGAIQ